MPMKFTAVCVTLSNKATDKKKTAETLSFFCLFETVDQRSGQQVPPVDQYEKYDFER